MLEDSQPDNTDLNPCTCEDKSVVIMNTPGQNVNAGAELVFDMMLKSEFEVTGRSIEFYRRQTQLTSRFQLYARDESESQSV